MCVYMSLYTQINLQCASVRGLRPYRLPIPSSQEVIDKKYCVFFVYTSGIRSRILQEILLFSFCFVYLYMYILFRIIQWTNYYIFSSNPGWPVRKRILKNKGVNNKITLNPDKVSGGRSRSESLGKILLTDEEVRSCKPHWPALMLKLDNFLINRPSNIFLS